MSGDEQDKPQTEDSAETEASSQEGDEQLTSKEALKKGMGLLWQAAKSAADEIQREVDVDQVKTSLEQAGRDIETAAQEAARAVEGFIERRGPAEPEPDYTDEWPPNNTPDTEDATPPDAADDAAKSKDRRDVRIQVDDD
jgi:hypothetical protein